MRINYTETEKAHERRTREGFYEKYLKGDGVDVGFKGHLEIGSPITKGAVGVDVDTPGYNGYELPFEPGSKDFVYASHVLEHIKDPTRALKAWFDTVKVGGFVVITVPHQYLYEKKKELPSNFNQDHKRLYVPSTLLLEVETALKPNSYRVVHLIDNDDGYYYDVPPHRHSVGCFEIELVIKKIKKPYWDLL